MLWCYSVFYSTKDIITGVRVDGECSLNDFLSLARMLLENHAPWVKIDLNGPLLLRENARVESSLTEGEKYEWIDIKIIEGDGSQEE